MSEILCSLGVCCGVRFVVHPVCIVHGADVCDYRPARDGSMLCVCLLSASCFLGAAPVAWGALASSVLWSPTLSSWAPPPRFCVPLNTLMVFVRKIGAV